MSCAWPGQTGPARDASRGRPIRLYARHGFVIEGAIRKEILVNGRYFDPHWMGLEL